VRRRIGISLAIAALGAVLPLVPVLAGVSAPAIVVPIHGRIDDGMAHLVDRSVADAETEHAAALVLDVDSRGGLSDAATAIRDRLLAAHVPVDAFVSGRAWDGGAVVALSATRVAMAPDASIASGAPLARSDTAVLRGALGAGAAVQQGIADEIAPQQAAALRDWGLDPARAVTPGYTLGESVLRLAANPVVSGLLLALGFAGLLIEMQTLHLVAGLIGTAALALFFGSHVYLGFVDEIVIGLALAGLAGVLLELHVLPGHGVAGGLGVVTLLAAIVLSFGAPFAVAAAQALGIAVVLSVAAFWFAVRLVPQNAFLQRVTFAGVQGPDYVAAPDYRRLIGRIGFATSYLRPTGHAAIDGERVDVLTEGEFVPAGSPVIVTRVEGARIFVRPRNAAMHTPPLSWKKPWSQ
jgi:membrane-bound serine protease (ClpP class)